MILCINNVNKFYIELILKYIKINNIIKYIDKIWLSIAQLLYSVLDHLTDKESQHTKMLEYKKKFFLIDIEYW